MKHLKISQITKRVNYPNLRTIVIRPGHNFVDAFEKWAVDRKTWSEPLYPRCCYGPAYILTTESVLGIVDAYEKSLVTFSKFEDIYITGKYRVYQE